MKEKTDLEKKYQKLLEDLGDLVMYIEEFSAFLPLAVCTVNPIGIIVNINKAFEELTGFRSIEIVGKSLIDIFLEKKEIEELQEVIMEKEIIRDKELTLISKNKKRIPVSISVSARKDREGNYIGIFVGITDISQLKELQKKLEERVKERTQQLQEKVEELEKFRKLAVGRELKMIELKEEIEKLKRELEKSKPQE